MTHPNEPAFPSQELDGQGCPRGPLESGLTKREYFAAMAMQGILAFSNPEQPCFKMEADIPFCVKVADALIAELNKEVE